MIKDNKYIFKYTKKCNMCGSSLANQKVLGKRLNQSQGFNPRNKVGITVTILKCRKCGLIFPNPLPKPFNLQDHYGISPKVYWDKEYFHQDEQYFSHQIQVLSDRFNLQGGSKVLDVGSGIGKSVIAMNNAGFKVMGIEPSQTFYNLAIEKMRINRYHLLNLPIEEASFPDEYFDFINFGAVLEHLYDPSNTINRAIKWLRKDGLIHIEVPSSNWFIGKMANLFYRLKGLDYVGNLSPMHIPYHLYEFDLKSFIENGKINSYNLEFYEFYVCKTYLPKQIDFSVKYFMKKTDSGMQLAVWLRK